LTPEEKAAVMLDLRPDPLAPAAEVNSEKRDSTMA
jgi:hypothetical protein